MLSFISHCSSKYVGPRDDLLNCILMASLDVARFRKEMTLRKRLHNQLMELRGNIRIICRVRPSLDPGRVNIGSDPSSPRKDRILTAIRFDEAGEIELRSQRTRRRHRFEFDEVLKPCDGQERVFQEIQPLVTSVVDGRDLCVLAYGQTGSGKTYTMEGTKEQPGVYVRTMQELFGQLRARAANHGTGSGFEWVVTLSMLEIYRESIRDLLAIPNAEADATDGSRPIGFSLSSVEIHDVGDALQYVEQGLELRATGQTDLNTHSSRSHMILSITVNVTDLASISNGGAGGKATTESRLRLVDLAGSERVGRSNATGARLEETKAINSSLSALGDVIASLKSHSAHVPYRNSKLTHYLQDSFGSGSKTLMLVQISPDQCDYDETLCSLNFASRARATELATATPKEKQAMRQPPSPHRGLCTTKTKVAASSHSRSSRSSGTNTLAGPTPSVAPNLSAGGNGAGNSNGGAGPTLATNGGVGPAFEFFVDANERPARPKIAQVTDAKCAPSPTRPLSLGVRRGGVEVTENHLTSGRKNGGCGRK